MVNPGKKLARHHLNKKTGMVIHTCDTIKVEGMGRRIAIQAWPKRKHEALSEK
jgi:hypothetical protein